MANVEAVSKKELDGMLQKAIKQVQSVGAEVPENINPRVRIYKATSYLGQCRRKDEQFEITISEYHLKNGYKAVMETMVHEVIHTIEGCFNHGNKWKMIADRVSSKYGYNISRVGNYSVKKVAQANMKYKLRCKGCGNIWHRQRLTKVVRFPELYSCGKCGGNLERVE